MPIDPTCDTLISLCEAARQFLPDPPGPATLWRWQGRGLKVAGDRVRLETVKVGHTRYTTADAFRRFVAAINPPAPPTAQERRERDARVDARLESAGLL